MRKRGFWIALSLTILWLCVIFGHSMMPASVSDDESRGVLAIVQRFLPFVTHHMVRKLAHFSVFAVLGGLLTVTFWQLPRFSAMKPLGCALLSALTDETIQLFVEGRSGQISDVWLDAFGALLATLLLWLFLKIRQTAPPKEKT